MVSGEPNITPIFSRSWLMKMAMVLVLLRLPVSLRRAWLISRAWRPTWVSPISPSISARGVRAATESMTTTSSAPGADEHVGDLERLLAGVGLGDEQLVDVDADGLGVDRVHGVLGVDVGADAAVALGLGHDVHGEGGLARRLRPVDLDDPPAGQAADAEGEVEGEGAGGDRLDLARWPLLAHLHDRALAELLRSGRAPCRVPCLGPSSAPSSIPLARVPPTICYLGQGICPVGQILS